MGKFIISEEEKKEILVQYKIISENEQTLPSKKIPIVELKNKTVTFQTKCEKIGDLPLKATITDAFYFLEDTPEGLFGDISFFIDNIEDPGKVPHEVYILHNTSQSFAFYIDNFIRGTGQKMRQFCKSTLWLSSPPLMDYIKSLKKYPLGLLKKKTKQKTDFQP